MLRFLDKFGVDCLHINGDFAGYDSLVDTVLDALAADGKPFVCPHPSDVCPRPSDSVSYTHLDVYKRQSLGQMQITLAALSDEKTKNG